MSDINTNDPANTMTIRVAPDGGFLDLIGCGGVSASLPVYGPVEVLGGAVARLTLIGDRLQSLTRADRYAVLRWCRHLLQPGGQLHLEVGSGDRQYPRQELEQAAWACGFDSWVRYFSGRAGLRKPTRIAAETPLVSILVPAYKSDHLAETLRSALDQTYTNCEIIVCDDGPSEEIAAIVADLNASSGDRAPIRYVRNRENLGGQKNYLQCFDLARGDYIKFLNDDDLLAPTCVEVMAACLRDHPAVTLVTSYRRLIDETGAAMPDRGFNAPLARVAAVIDGRHVATRLLTEKINRIGEPTTAMFRKQDMLDSRPHLFSFQNMPARRNGDTFIWASLLSRGDVASLPQPLSCFRQHGGQVQRDPEFVADALKVWDELAADAAGVGLVHRSFIGGWSLLPLSVVAETGDAMIGTESGSESDTEVLRLLQTNDLSAATDRLRGLLYADPQNLRLRSDLAGVTWERGRQQTALSEVLLALSTGDDQVALLNLRDMLTFLGRAEDAAQLEGRLVAATA